MGRATAAELSSSFFCMKPCRNKITQPKNKITQSTPSEAKLYLREFYMQRYVPEVLRKPCMCASATTYLEKLTLGMEHASCKQITPKLERHSDFKLDNADMMHFSSMRQEAEQTQNAITTDDRLKVYWISNTQCIPFRYHASFLTCRATEPLLSSCKCAVSSNRRGPVAQHGKHALEPHASRHRSHDDLCLVHETNQPGRSLSE